MTLRVLPASQSVPAAVDKSSRPHLWTELFFMEAEAASSPARPVGTASVGGLRSGISGLGLVVDVRARAVRARRTVWWRRLQSRHRSVRPLQRSGWARPGAAPGTGSKLGCASPTEPLRPLIVSGGDVP